MHKKTTVFILGSILCTLFGTPAVLSNLIFAQSSDNDDQSNSMSLGSPLLEKLKGASSISNIQTISWVDGIEITGVNVGENQATVTLERVSTQDNNLGSSEPVTVIVIRTPGSSIKSLLALMEASNKLSGKNNTSPLAGLIGQLGAQSGGPAGLNASSLGALAALNVSDTIKPLQALLQLGKDTELGVGNIVGGDWEKPRTITTGISTLGGLLGMEGNQNSDPRVHLSMVLVVPYSGKTSFGSVDFR